MFPRTQAHSPSSFCHLWFVLILTLIAVWALTFPHARVSPGVFTEGECTSSIGFLLNMRTLLQTWSTPWGQCVLTEKCTEEKSITEHDQGCVNQESGGWGKQWGSLSGTAIVSSTEFTVGGRGNVQMGNSLQAFWKTGISSKFRDPVLFLFKWTFSHRHPLTLQLQLFCIFIYLFSTTDKLTLNTPLIQSFSKLFTELYNVTGTVPSSRGTVISRNKWSKSGGDYVNKINK